MMAEGRRQRVMEQLVSLRAIAVLRADEADAAVSAACAIVAGGIGAIEVTMTVPNAYEVLQKLATRTSAILGAGTVLTAEQVDLCIESGAQFIVSPTCCPDVIERAKERETLVIPGAMTPTEILHAWHLGGDMVKVFPAARLGPEFLSDLRGPFPDIPLVPTGGITDENAVSYLKAGATLLCFGSWLVDRRAMSERRFEVITAKARRIDDLITGYKEAPNG
jgi:2-dehydro-3-deoxyphosphogluconate aldolase / (4S)-4-hydroxy-2-oxoglutarate aldolase